MLTPRSSDVAQRRSMSDSQKVIDIPRLLRKSTLNDHVVVNPLEATAEQGQTVELMKLRRDFVGFSSPQTSDEANESKDAQNPHDIYLSIPQAELCEVKPCNSGWFATLVIDKESKLAIEAFISAGRRHFKQMGTDAGYISPFADPLAHEIRMVPNAHARLTVQVRHVWLRFKCLLSARGAHVCGTPTMMHIGL